MARGKTRSRQTTTRVSRSSTRRESDVSEQPNENNAAGTSSAEPENLTPDVHVEATSSLTHAEGGSESSSPEVPQARMSVGTDVVVHAAVGPGEASSSSGVTAYARGQISPQHCLTAATPSTSCHYRFGRHLQNSSSPKSKETYKSHEMQTETTTETHHVHKVWTIRNWSGIPQTEGYIVYDEEFEFVNHRWRLRLYPGGVTENVKGYISFYLDCRDATDEHPAYERHTFRVVNQLDRTKSWEQHSLPYKEHKDPDGWGWGKFLSHQNLRDEKSGFRVNDTVIIELELYVYGDKKNTTVKALKETVEHFESVVEVPASTLAEDLCELFNTSNFSDVVFVVDGVRFPAHKAILAIRSPMLYAMFGCGMRESSATEVVVDDIDKDVFQEILRFIYSGHVSLEMLETQPMQLLAAADKYDLYRLKCICENLLFERMTCEDCADVLVAADMHNASALKSRCLSFMTESAGRVREVMDSDAFKHLSDTRPQLLVAIMQAMSDESIIMTPSKKRFLELTDHFGATSNKRQRR